MSAFALPNFNLSCRVWHRAGRSPAVYPSPDLTVQCNLANGRVSHVLNSQQRLDTQNSLGASASVLFPKGSDIRDASVDRLPDAVEIPALSGRFYWVAFVDDIAKGFVNEHRWAVCPKIFTNGYYDYRWPSPIP
jgi:hypothetical protein